MQRLSYILWLAIFVGGNPAAPAFAQAPTGSGHSLHLLGIEPLSPQHRPPHATHYAPAPQTSAADYQTRPGEALRVDPVQYPLDKRTWENIPSDSAIPSEPYAPQDLFSAPAGPAVATTAPIPDPWVSLGEIFTEATYLTSAGGLEGLGWTTFEIRSKINFPRARMFALAPRFGWHLLDGPRVTDLPGQLYDASLEVVVSLPLAENVFMQTAVSPSFFTDGHNTTSDAFRIPARLLFFWSYSEHLTLSGGLAYLDREDISFLPSVGLIYRPHDAFKMELIIPRPRLAWQISSDGTVDRWAYVVGELGGGSWGIQRTSGVNDIATYGDYRCMLGWEQIHKQGLDLRFEVGVVFSRSIEYRSGIGDRDLPQSGIVRIALTY